MLYLKFVGCVSLLLGAFNLEAVKTRSQKQEEDQRKLTRACPEVPISNEDVANMDSRPSKIILKFELPTNFKVSRTYPHLTEDNHIGLISLTQLANSPQLFYNNETDHYALAINGYTFSNKDTDLKITSYTYMAVVFSLKNKFEYAPYAFSDNTSEARPTLIAKAFAISNLTKIPYPEIKTEQHILPYQITAKGYCYLPIQIKYGESQEISFSLVEGNPFLAK